MYNIYIYIYVCLNYTDNAPIVFRSSRGFYKLKVGGAPLLAPICSFITVEKGGDLMI